MKKENWNNITKDSRDRFITLYKIGGKKELIRELKAVGWDYNETVKQLADKDQKIAKYKNTYFWVSD